MSKPVAIEVRGLGKRYYIGKQQEGPRSVRAAIAGSFLAPFQRLQSLIRYNLPDFAQQEFWALRDVSFDVPRGEVLGVIGRNGAGKSTLLKLLTNISAPTEGIARIHGRVGSLLEVGTGFHPELTGRENVFMNGIMLGMKQVEVRKRFDEIVDFSGIEEFIDTPIKRYSSGMQVRLAFSVAAHLDPEVLLVDEVLSVGDAEFRRRCMGMMRDVTTQGRTVLLVSHSMASIQNLCDQVLLLDKGRMVMLDEPDLVVNEYLMRNRDNAASDSADLRSHPNRSRHLTPTFTGIRLLNAEGETTSAIMVGQPLTIEIQLDTEQRRYDNAAMFVSVTDDREQQITRFGTTWHYEEPVTVEGRMRVVIRWPECNLAPGSYYLAIKLRTANDANEYGGRAVDQIENALQFEVIEGDLFGTGRGIKEGQVIIWAKATWDIEPQSVIRAESS